MAEDMKIDQIVEVPDTPDRITVRGDDQKRLCNPEKRGRALNAAVEMNNSTCTTSSPSEKSYPSQNAPIFRRGQTKHSNGAEKMEKGKNISSKVSSKSSRRGISVLDLTEENGASQQLKPAFSLGASRDHATEAKKAPKATIGNSLLPAISDSSVTSRNPFTGICKLPGSNTSVDRGKGISLSRDSQSQNEKQVSLPPFVSTSPQGRGHKRLVRNGCILPINIATRAKQLAEQRNLQTEDVQQSHADHVLSSNTVSPNSVDDIVARERCNGRGKGKEVLIPPPFNGRNAGTFCTASSSPVINHEEVTGTSNDTRNSLQYSGGQGGWRTTHNERNANQHLYDVHGHPRNNGVGRCFNRRNTYLVNGRNIGSDQSCTRVHGSQSDHTAQPISVIIPDVEQLSVNRPTADILSKRQRKRESSGESSSSYPEVVELLSTPRNSASSSRSRVLDPEVVELMSTPRYKSSEDLDDNDNNSLEARARQVEADEILARELQEQLYHDDSIEDRGIDEHLAWELQHAEDSLPTSIDSHSRNHPVRFPRANRQPRILPNQSSSRRRPEPLAFSNRMARLRSRATSRTRASNISSRGRSPQFPLDMDLDMRLDILEALENSMGDFSDMGVVDGIFNAGRDFNASDYEMLLALDERNHQHTGASTNMINSLPQLTIQNDNMTEPCAICLETPARGETIRHLPCLHKFHKDCIDPWLQRKTTCPVCKSSIT
ncbi:hypothetical protein PHAVU_007G236500 [Phaseolus vulgaris]|uniref:RING-type domain-containing protein n=1 Tax=Phaseolus vulgaris TaxID=3885 RepID=V7BK44_PHAVU|nr:hypothetical protein PHAVU_007G236500g [Phaseolus vulgaris]ESW17403.1 hypothetical protein PHAVU_007G236500g [Phaseolus vulgaris]